MRTGISLRWGRCRWGRSFPSWKLDGGFMMVFGIAFRVAGLVGKRGVVIDARERTTVDQLSGEKFVIEVDPIEVFSKPLKQVLCIDENGDTFGHHAPFKPISQD